MWQRISLLMFFKRTKSSMENTSSLSLISLFVRGIIWLWKIKEKNRLQDGESLGRKSETIYFERLKSFLWIKKIYFTFWNRTLQNSGGVAYCHFPFIDTTDSFHFNLWFKLLLRLIAGGMANSTRTILWRRSKLNLHFHI